MRFERVCRDCGTTCSPLDSRELGWSVESGGWVQYQGRAHLAKDIVLCPACQPEEVTC